MKIDRQHNHDNAHQGQDVHEDGQRPGGERLVNGIDIRGQTGDQAPDRRTLKKARRQFLHVREQVAPQVGQTALGDQHRGLELSIEEQKLAEQGGGKQQSNARQPRSVPLLNIPVHTQLEQIRLGQETSGGQRQTDHGHNKGRAVRPDIDPQTAQERQVIGFAEGGFVLSLVHSSASSSSSA